MLDLEIFFKIAVGAIGALIGYVLHGLDARLDRQSEIDDALADKVQRIEVLVAGEYIRRDEVSRMFSELFRKIDIILMKLDEKADK